MSFHRHACPSTFSPPPLARSNPQTSLSSSSCSLFASPSHWNNNLLHRRDESRRLQPWLPHHLLLLVNNLNLHPPPIDSPSRSRSAHPSLPLQLHSPPHRRILLHHIFPPFSRNRLHSRYHQLERGMDDRQARRRFGSRGKASASGNDVWKWQWSVRSGRRERDEWVDGGAE